MQEFSNPVLLRRTVMMKSDFSITAFKFAFLMTLFVALAFPAPAAPQKDSPEPLAISRQDRLKVFDEVWQAVNKHYFDPQFNGLNWERVKEQYRPQVETVTSKMQLGETLQKMLDELRSSHLRINLNVKFKKQHVEQDLARKVSRKEDFYFDAGMKYITIDGKLIVSEVAEGSGAQLAGVQRGWEVTHWNGESAQSDSPFTCELNRQATVRFVDRQGEEKQLVLTCKLYSVPPSPPERITRTLENGVAYLRFNEFSPGTESWLTGQVAQAQNAPAIIIDLRNNPGGTVAVLEKCLAPFFNVPTVFGEFRERNGKQPPLKTKGQGQKAYQGGVVVLIGEKTTSAAEIFAAALQETGRGQVVGRQSRGDVLGSLSYGLSHGFRLDIPVWDYHTAKGVRPEGRGIIPNQPVTLTLKDFLENRDLDLEHALKLLQKP